MEFLSWFSWQSLAAAGAAVALLIGGNWAKIRAALPKIGGGTVTPGSDAGIHAALDACLLLQRHYEASGCSEGIRAVQVCQSHLLEKPGTHLT